MKLPGYQADRDPWGTGSWWLRETMKTPKTPGEALKLLTELTDDQFRQQAWIDRLLKKKLTEDEYLKHQMEVKSA